MMAKYRVFSLEISPNEIKWQLWNKAMKSQIHLLGKPISEDLQVV